MFLWAATTLDKNDVADLKKTEKDAIWDAGSKHYVNVVRYGKRSEFKVDKGGALSWSEYVLARF